MNDPHEFLETCAAPGWDSYNAKPVTEQAIRSAARLRFVPTPQGGVQAEWDGVEVEFDSEGRLCSIFVDRQGGQSERHGPLLSVQDQLVRDQDDLEKP